MLALLPLVMGLVNGGSLGAVLGGLSIGQWIGIAEAAVNAAPDVIQDLSALHPALAALTGALGKGFSPAAAGQTAKDWLAANGQAAIDVQEELGK